jgi:Uma2 family endonuclease
MNSRTIATLQNPIDRPSNPCLDQRIVQSDRTWEQFKLVQQGLQNSRGVRLFFYQGTIEILLPGLDHEFYKSIIGMLLELWFLEKNIEFAPTGSMTQEQPGTAFAEPDESYSIGQPKSMPDLSIEVKFTSGGIDKLACYKALGASEV